jgi:hypothetical protein
MTSITYIENESTITLIKGTSGMNRLEEIDELNWDEVSDYDSEDTGSELQTTYISTSGQKNVDSRASLKENSGFVNISGETGINDFKRTNSVSTKCTNNSFGYNGMGFRKTQSDLFDICLKVDNQDQDLK